MTGTCPRCGTEIDGNAPLDRFQNTKVEPCGHTLSASELEAISNV